jgi:ATP-dependent Clp protease protease subunit
VIDHNSVGPVIEQLTEIAMMPPHAQPENTILFINSVGGRMDAACQLIDLIREIPIPVITYGTGMVASAGLMILMAGNKGTRCATDGTILMSHQYSSGSDGKHHELIAANIEHKMIDAIIMKRYKKFTGKSESYIRKNLLPANDVYLTAEQALEHGLIDQVIKTN